MKLNKNSIVLLVTVSMLLIPVWGLTTLDIETANRYSTFICFILTLFLYTILVDHNVKNRRYLFMLGPAFYVIAYIIARNQFGFKEFFFAPIPWLFIILLIWIQINNHKAYVPIIIFLSASYLYSFHMYPTFERLTTLQPDFELKSDESIISNIRIDDYSFLIRDSLYSKLNFSNQPFIVETWNEKCGPCIASMRDLEPVIDSLGIKHIFLYGNMGRNNLSIPEIYNFQYISDKSKIYVDPENQFLNDMNISAFPYLLFYNSSGELVDNIQGYHSSYSHDIVDKLKKFKRTYITENSSEHQK